MAAPIEAYFRFRLLDFDEILSELLVDKAMELRFIGGVYGGNVRPTPFLCLVLKMLQIQPDKDIVIEFIKNEDFKYVRALGALYMRIVGTSLDCYKYIEPLYLDYRKLRKINTMGQFEMCHMDEFVDEILREERACDVILPRVQKRYVLEENNQLEPRISALDDDLEEMEEEDQENKNAGKIPSPDRAGQVDWDVARRSPSPRYRRGTSPSPTRRRGHSRDRERERNRPDRDRGERDRGERDSRRDRGERDSRRDREERGQRGRRSWSKTRERRSGHKHKHGDDESGRRKHHKSKKSKHDHDSRGDREDRKHSSKSSQGSKIDLEIQEANRLRASLGLAPLRP